MSAHVAMFRNKYYAVLDVPRDVRKIIGKSRFKKTLETDSRKVAVRRAAPLIAMWRSDIQTARDGNKSARTLDIEYHRRTLASLSNDRDEDGESEQGTYFGVLTDMADDMEMEEDGKGVAFIKRVTGEWTDTDAHIDDWLVSLSDTEKTKDMKRRDVELFATKFPIVQNVTKKEVKAWCISQMTEGGLKFATVNKSLGAVRSYWAYLQSIEVIPQDFKPLHDLGIKRKQDKDSETRPFTAKAVVDLQRAAAALGDKELADLIRLAMWTGARIEELCSLKVENVTKDAIQIIDAKTPSGWREVPIHSKLKPTMKRLVKDSADGFVMLGLSENKYGDRSNAIGKRFGRLKTGKGFRPRVETFHSIRKTVTTLLENAGVPESTAADIVGHDKPTMTYGLYSGGTSLEVKREALERIEYPIDS
jgi:integrase